MFDTLINNKLNPYLLSLINDTQYCFRKGYSLYCQHIDIQTIIFNALNDPKVLAIDLVFLDLSNAFDTISVELLLEKLKNSGIRDDFLILIKNNLLDRKKFVNYSKCKSYIFVVNSGVAQVGVLLYISIFL
jgi:hypothetical protein